MGKVEREEKESETCFVIGSIRSMPVQCCRSGYVKRRKDAGARAVKMVGATSEKEEPETGQDEIRLGAAEHVCKLHCLEYHL